MYSVGHANKSLNKSGQNDKIMGILNFQGHNWLLGWKETSALLRFWRERLISYKRSAKILFLNGLSAGVIQTVLLLWSSFLPLVVPLFFVFTIMNTCIGCSRFSY